MSKLERWATDPARSPQYHLRHLRFVTEKLRGKENYVTKFTYEWLKNQLDRLTDEQLKQPVQIFGPETGDHTKMVLLKPVYAFGTIEELCHVEGEIDRETRGPDFSHHPEQVVICVDYAPFSQLGDTMYEMEEGGMRGNVTGKLFDTFSDKEIVEQTPVPGETNVG